MFTDPASINLVIYRLHVEKIRILLQPSPMGNVPKLTFDTDSHVTDNTVPTSLQTQQQND